MRQHFFREFFKTRGILSEQDGEQFVLTTSVDGFAEALLDFLLKLACADQLPQLLDREVGGLRMVLGGNWRADGFFLFSLIFSYSKGFLDGFIEAIKVF